MNKKNQVKSFKICVRTNNFLPSGVFSGTCSTDCARLKVVGWWVITAALDEDRQIPPPNDVTLPCVEAWCLIVI